MSVLALTCESCGSPVSREVPEGVPEKLIAWAAKFPARCPACQATADEQDELQRVYQEAQQADRIFRTRLGASGLPAKHHRTLNDLVGSSDPLALVECDRWAREGGGLYLWGPWGTGKTTLAGATAFDMLHHHKLIWMPASQLLADLSADWGSERRDRAVDVLVGDYALVLDDVDKVRDSQYGVENLHQLVDQRVEHERPLLLTANVPIGELASRYSPAIASRLAGYCRVVKVEGVDRRLGGGGPR